MRMDTAAAGVHACCAGNIFNLFFLEQELVLVNHLLVKTPGGSCQRSYTGCALGWPVPVTNDLPLLVKSFHSTSLKTRRSVGLWVGL